MQLTRLSLKNFRNFVRLDVDIPAGYMIFVGKNAQGKTSLLEAIYYLATFTSYHADSDRQLINLLHGQEMQSAAIIVADFVKGGRTHRLDIRISQERSKVSGSNRLRKEVYLDGVKSKLGDVIGTFNAVLFLPQMMYIIDGAPERRRRYLNLLLAQIMRGYASALSEYSRVLANRNALLKSLRDVGGDPGQLTFWDNQLAVLGAQIIYARIEAIQSLENAAQPIHRKLTSGQEILRLQYLPSFDPLPETNGQFSLGLNDPRDRSQFTMEQIQNRFAEGLAANRTEEINRGVTLTGPHRDEFRTFASGVDLGTYGSRGQIRTVLLSIKLAEMTWMHQKTGHRPVLLLDEVLAELDQERRQELINALTASDQAFMTTADIAPFPADFLEVAQIWPIEEGRLVQS